MFVFICRNTIIFFFSKFDSFHALPDTYMIFYRKSQINVKEIKQNIMWETKNELNGSKKIDLFQNI